MRIYNSYHNFSLEENSLADWLMDFKFGEYRHKIITEDLRFLKSEIF